MKLKIVSQGHANNTRIVDAETGEEVERVEMVVVYIEAGQPTKATVTLYGVEVEVEAEVAE